MASDAPPHPFTQEGATAMTTTPTSSTTTTYRVSGMTCGHCVSAVTAEVSALAGVTEVQVDLETGSVTVTSRSPLDDAAVRVAVEEAGYQLAD